MGTRSDICEALRRPGEEIVTSGSRCFQLFLLVLYNVEKPAEVAPPFEIRCPFPCHRSM